MEVSACDLPLALTFLCPARMSWQLSPYFWCFLDGNKSSTFVQTQCWAFFLPGQATRLCSVSTPATIGAHTPNPEYRERTPASPAAGAHCFPLVLRPEKMSFRLHCKALQKWEYLVPIESGLFTGVEAMGGARWGPQLWDWKSLESARQTQTRNLFFFFPGVKSGPKCPPLTPFPLGLHYTCL